MPDTVAKAEDWFYDVTLAEPYVDTNSGRTYIRARQSPVWSADIPAEAEAGVLYRGMSWAEWQEVQRTGVIQSLGTHNLGPAQEGLTYWSPDPGTAAYYATGFAPWPFLPTFGRPGIVLRITDPGTGIVKTKGSDEIGIRGAIPLSAVTAVYEGRVYAVRPGELDLHREMRPTWVEGSRLSPSTQRVWRKMGLLLDETGRILGPPQAALPPRPPGPWDRNADVRRPIRHDLSRPAEGVVTVLIELPDIGTIEVSNLPLHLFRRHRDGESVLDREFLWVRTINVRPEMRRLGHGTRLYELAFREAQRRGFKGLASLHADRSAMADAAWNALARRHVVEPGTEPLGRVRDLDPAVAEDRASLRSDRLIDLKGTQFDGFADDVRPTTAGDFFDDQLGDLQQVPEPLIHSMTNKSPEMGGHRDLERFRITLPGMGFIEVSNDRWVHDRRGNVSRHRYDREFVWVDYIDVEVPFRNRGLGMYLYELAFREAQRRGFKGLASAHAERSEMAARAWTGMARKHTVVERLDTSRAPEHLMPADFLLKLHEPSRREAITELLTTTLDTKGLVLPDGHPSLVADFAEAIAARLRLMPGIHGDPHPGMAYRGRQWTTREELAAFLERGETTTTTDVYEEAARAVRDAIADETRRYGVLLEVEQFGFEGARDMFDPAGAVRRAWVMVRDETGHVQVLQVPDAILHPRLALSPRTPFGDFAYDYDHTIRENGTVFRGLTAEDADEIRRTGQLRAAGDGMVFADDLATAERAVNTGQHNPARTGKATYVVQVRATGTDIARPYLPSGWRRTGDPGPATLPPGKVISAVRIARVWMFDASGGATELTQLPKPSTVEVANRPIINPGVRAHLAKSAAFMELFTDPASLDLLVQANSAMDGSTPAVPYVLFPEILVTKLARIHGPDVLRRIRLIEIDSQELDDNAWSGTWEASIRKLTLSVETTQLLRGLLLTIRALPAAERTAARLRRLFAEHPEWVGAIQTINHELVHVRDDAPFTTLQYERVIDEGLTELQSRRETTALIFGGEWGKTYKRDRRLRDNPPRSYNKQVQALRWFERRFGTRALEHLWTAGPRRVPLVAAAVRPWLRATIASWPVDYTWAPGRPIPLSIRMFGSDAEKADLLRALETLSNERVVELLMDGTIPNIDPHRVRMGAPRDPQRPSPDGWPLPFLRIGVPELQHAFAQTHATDGDDRRGMGGRWNQIKASEKPPPVFDSDIRYYKERHKEFRKTLESGLWTPPVGRSATVQGPRFRQVTGVWESLEIPLWTSERQTILRIPREVGGSTDESSTAYWSGRFTTRPAQVPGTYNIVGLLQLLAWHLGVSDHLDEVVLPTVRRFVHDSIPMGLESDSVYTFRSASTGAVLRRGGQPVPMHVENALAMTLEAEHLLRGFLWTVRHRGFDAAVAVSDYVWVLRDAARALLQLDTRVSSTSHVDFYDRLLLVGYTEIYIRRYGIPFLYPYRQWEVDRPWPRRLARLPANILDGRDMPDERPAGLFLYSPILGPLRWLERRFGRFAALRLWRGAVGNALDRKLQLIDLLLDWMPMAFARHPDPAVSEAMDELVGMATRGPATQTWVVTWLSGRTLHVQATSVETALRAARDATLDPDDIVEVEHVPTCFHCGYVVTEEELDPGIGVMPNHVSLRPNDDHTEPCVGSQHPPEYDTVFDEPHSAVPGWGTLPTSGDLIPRLLFEGVWEDLDNGRHNLAWWRRTLTLGRRAD